MGETFISPEKIKALEDRMRDLGIKDEDIVERFVRARGRGGQKVNKTSSCVVLRHVPSGLEVKMQKERSQPLNRYRARKRLCELMEEFRFRSAAGGSEPGVKSPAARKAAKIRKQKQRRRRRSRSG